MKLKKYNILLVNTQLNNINEERFKQLEYVLNYLKQFVNNDITIICGDLNALPNSQEINLLRENGFIDENIQHSHENGVTIDYIFYKTNVELDVKSKIILKNYSDHYCLVNSFRFLK